VWYSAQRNGALGILDPATGQSREVKLGPKSAPHGVIQGPDGAAWLTDGGQNAIVRVDPKTNEVRVWKLPANSGYANLNTATFDRDGVHWFTGQSGIYGCLDPRTGDIKVWKAPGGPGPYGIAATPEGDIYYASLAGNHIAKIDKATGAATVIEPPSKGQGARRVWSDSAGRIWVAEWNAGQLGLYDPKANSWREWKLPGQRPKAYAVYVDDRDIVWVSDWGANAIVSFDPSTEMTRALL
jgi:virginiamycin B lyase